MSSAQPIDYSSNYHLSPYYDCSNPFLPKKDPDLPLTKTESKFLELYLPFAQGMKALCKSKTRWRHKDIEVATHALIVVAFLKETPFCNKEVTQKLIAFLIKTGRDLLKETANEPPPPPPVIKPLPIHLIKQSDSSNQKVNGITANAFFHASRA